MELRTTSSRLIALCPSGAPLCPRCGRPYVDTQVPADGRVMRFCARKRARTGGNCGGRAYIIGLDGDACAVIPIGPDEWEQLSAHRGNQVLRYLGVLVEWVKRAPAA